MISQVTRLGESLATAFVMTAMPVPTSSNLAGRAGAGHSLALGPASPSPNLTSLWPRRTGGEEHVLGARYGHHPSRYSSVAR